MNKMLIFSKLVRLATFSVDFEMTKNFGLKESFLIRNKWMMKNLLQFLMVAELKFKKQTLKILKLLNFLKISLFIL